MQADAFASDAFASSFADSVNPPNLYPESPPLQTPLRPPAADQQDAAPVPTPPGPDSTNRKLLSHLPPVVGSYLQYANKSVRYHPIPADLDAVREKLFNVEHNLLLESQAIADYWWHMSSVWQRSVKPTKEYNGTVIEAWECRNRRRVSAQDGKTSHGTGARKKPTKDDLLTGVQECKPRISLTSYTIHAEGLPEPCHPGMGNCLCIPEWLFIRPAQKTKNLRILHTHTIDICDRFKRSDSLMYFAKVKVEEGYNYTAVMNHIRGKYGAVTQEVQHLLKSDCSNVSRHWRMANKDVILRDQVVEEEFALDRQRKECLDAIASTDVDNLRRALTEVCRQLPAAVDIISPFMQTSTMADTTAGIWEGDKIKVPHPGLPLRAYKGVTSQTFELTAPGPEPIQDRPTTPVDVNSNRYPESYHLHPPGPVDYRYMNKQPGPPQEGQLVHVNGTSISGQAQSLHAALESSASDPEAASRVLVNAANPNTIPRPRTLPYASMQQPPPPTYPAPMWSQNTAFQPRSSIGGGSFSSPARTLPPISDRPAWAQPKRKAVDDDTIDVRPAQQPRADTNAIEMQLQHELTAMT